MSATFGVITDWFGFSTASGLVGKLLPISSDNGDDKKRVCVTNATWDSGGTTQTGGAGRYSSGVDSTSNVWRNPTVTYRVVGDITFACQLGKAYAAVGSVSGYMITEVEVVTLIGEFPTIRVSGVATEGVDAINLFNVSVPVVAAAHAQNLLSALGGDTILQRCTLRAKAEPVVVAENNFPCASDVVRGQYVVTADTLALDDGDVPSAANGFVLVGKPVSTRESNVAGYSLTFQKEIT